MAIRLPCQCGVGGATLARPGPVVSWNWVGVPPPSLSLPYRLSLQPLLKKVGDRLDRLGKVNLLSKFQFPSSYGLRVKVY